MDSNGGGVPRTELLDLTENVLISLLGALDFESLLVLARTGKKLNAVTNDDLLWMELCRPWENAVNLKSWRAQMDSAKALFRLLRSLSKLAGVWSHNNHSLQGRLLYMTWGTGGMEGWLVAPGIIDDNEIMYVKMLDVIGMPDGSHKVEYVLTESDLESQSDPVLPCIILPSSQSQNHFVLESRDKSGTELERIRNGVLVETARSEDLGVYLPGAGMAEPPEVKSWRIVYTRVNFGEPTPEQELAGLWAGYYGGSHGWEILTVSYSDDGFILGTKATGDSNVPTGEVSFRACIETEETTDFPDVVGITIEDEPPPRFTKMYKGQGRIAETNFINPMWAEGFLLVEDSGNFHFAWQEIGMIGYKRLDMEATYKNNPVDGSATG